MKNGFSPLWMLCVLTASACNVPDPPEQAASVLAEVYSMYLAEVEPPAREAEREALDSAAFAQRLASCARGEEVRVVRQDVRAFFEREDVRSACQRYGRALEGASGQGMGCAR